MMKLSEVWDLLNHAAAIDGRVDNGEVAAREWHAILGARDWLGHDLALAALRDHYADDTVPVLPRHVLECAREIRRRRLERTPLPDPPGYPGADEWQAMAEAATRVIADGGDAAQARCAMQAVADAWPRELDGKR